MFIAMTISPIISIFLSVVIKSIVSDTLFDRVDKGFLLKERVDTPKEVFLDDFFWTGSGDGSPIYGTNVNTGIRKLKDVIIKTETVLSTVYVDNQNVLENPMCLSCKPDEHNIPVNLSIKERKYWLITVISGHYSTSDFPFLENKLAALYTLAFRRQQSHHLGINNTLSQINSRLDDERGNNTLITKHKRESNLQNTENITLNKALLENLTEDVEYSDRNELIADNDLLTDVKVRILIHNLSVIPELIENHTNKENDKKQQQICNQTEIVYSVFVGKNPVLASTAAADMKLVNEMEATALFRESVFLIAEPYLREPRATPLVPGASYTESGFVAIFKQNLLIFAICAIIALLAFLLLIGVFFTHQSKGHVQESGRPVINETEHHSSSAIIGINNLAYQNPTLNQKINSPYIQFPPPPTHSQQCLTNSLENSSDSSLYCPVDSQTDLQEMLNEKAATLFSKSEIPRSDIKLTDNDIYTSVISTKSRRRQLKHKHKRGGNRVGSVNRSTTQENMCTTYPKYESYDSFNTGNNYNSSKTCMGKNYDNGNIVPRMMEALRHDPDKTETSYFEQSSETGSIGSFLSMNSVKCFPTNQLPQPLHRVLVPVSVTYYDHIEDSQSENASDIVPMEVGVHLKSSESYNTRDMQGTTNSDNADPGLVNPVMWKVQHLQFSESEPTIESPEKNPTESQTRFQGLLDDAMEMYSSKGNLTIQPKQNEKIGSQIEFQPKRGRSASGFRCNKPNSTDRPFTAQPRQETNEQPQISSYNAWGSCNQSLLARPISAGPFHRPDPPNVDVTRVFAHQHAKNELPGAPLINAIQNELRKLKRESSQ